MEYLWVALGSVALVATVIAVWFRRKGVAPQPNEAEGLAPPEAASMAVERDLELLRRLSPEDRNRFWWQFDIPDKGLYLLLSKFDPEDGVRLMKLRDRWIDAKLSTSPVDSGFSRSISSGSPESKPSGARL